jgi:hypothetical protein
MMSIVAPPASFEDTPNLGSRGGYESFT